MKNRAKYRIIFNFVHLLEQYPFEAITTKLICAHSNVNRSTFYANYKDKYDLYDIIQNYHKKKYINLLDTLYNDFEDVKSNNMKIHKFFVIVLKYIQRKKAFFHAVFITHPNREIAIEYFQLTKVKYEKILTNYNTTIENKSAFVTYTLGGQTAILLSWLKDGCQESPHKIADILLANTIKLQR